MNNLEYPLLTKWITAVHSQNPDTVTACYAENAVLLPTVSNQLRFTQEERRDYFVTFLAKKPQCRLLTLAVHDASENTDILSGTYVFTFSDDSEATARFSYVYQDGLILQHHSSLMPE